MTSTPNNPRDTSAAADTSTAAPVEKKVTASTASAGAIALIVLTALSQAQTDNLFHGFPDWATVLIGTVIAALGTFIAGRVAPHTPRPDLATYQR